MKQFKIIMGISFQNIRKWTVNYRIWMIFAVIMILIHSYWNDIHTISDYLGASPSLWVFPFLYSQFYMKLIFTLPLVLLFCDAPFIDDNQIFVIVRAHRLKWLCGEQFYIVIASALYYIFIFAATVLFGLQYADFDTGWGKVLHTISETNIAGYLQCHFVSVSGFVIKYFTPLQGIWFTFLLSWLNGIVIGEIIFFFNLCTKTKYTGMIISSSLVLFDSFIENYNENLLKYSPFSWNTLDNLDVGGKTNNPSFVYCIIVICTLIVAFMLLVFLFGRKIQINSERT